MPAYETDNEQMELVKKWWADYGKWIIIAVIIGLGAGFGWRYWQQQQVEQRQQASLLYQQLIVADSKNDHDTVLQMSTEITQRYSSLEYAAMANLVAAKNALAQNNVDLAAQKLQWVLDHSRTPSIKQIARLRKARVLLMQNKTAEAQKLLATVDDKIYQPVIDEIQGDIYTQLGDLPKARQSYQAAQLGLSAVLGEDVLLSMKLAQP